MKANSFFFYLRSHKPVIIISTAIAILLIGLNQWLQHQDRTAKSDPCKDKYAHQGSNQCLSQNTNIAPTKNIAPENKHPLQAPEIAKPISPAKQKVQPPLKANPKVSSGVPATFKTTQAFKEYKPKYTIAIADPSNYGDRFSADVYGHPVNNSAIAVLHETVGSAMSAINTFRTPHNDIRKQVSYHALITLDGIIIYLVPSDKRAFGAGNSVFESSQGIETVKTNIDLPPSVNNFAYHISLETPLDGRKNQRSHSGYTDAQYKALAWLLSLSNIPDNRITTHKNVDRSGQRFDPRSFDFDKFFEILHTYRQPNQSKVSTQMN